MEKVLGEIRAGISAPETKWRREDERGLMVFHGDASPWRLLVVSQGSHQMATATHLKQFLVVRLTDELTELAFSRALAVLG